MAPHGFRMCYKEESISILKECNLPTVIQALPVSMEICGEKILLVLVYLLPRHQVSTFINGMISIFRKAWKDEWIILLGEFNMDQMLQENVNRLVRLKDISNLQQRLRYSSHQLEGILDLVYLFHGFYLPTTTLLSFVFNFRSFKGIDKKSKIGTTVDKEKNF